MSRSVRFAVVATSASALLGLAGCGGSDSGATTRHQPSTTSTVASKAGLIGSWHRAQSCEEMLEAFRLAGLEESHRDWLQGNFFDGEPGPTRGDQCSGALGPLEHDHFFRADGGFGSHDQNGQEVDHGDYEQVDEDTVRFPSHADEFGYTGDLLADFEVTADTLKFKVTVPEVCDNTCATAYAWALSAFASGPWERGEVPK